MKAEQVEHALSGAVGKAQDFLGEITGDERLQMEGIARRAASELQQRYSKLLEQWAHLPRRKPRITLLALAGVTLTVVWLVKHKSA